MAGIVRQTSYLAESRGRQLEQYKLLPRMDALLQAFSADWRGSPAVRRG